MKKVNVYLMTTILFLSVVGCSNTNVNSNSYSNTNSYLIGEDNVGAVSFSSTIKQLKKNFKNVNVEEINDDEYGASIKVELSNTSEKEIVLDVCYENENKDKCCILAIFVYSPKYKTTDSIYIGQTREEIIKKGSEIYSTVTENGYFKPDENTKRFYFNKNDKIERIVMYSKRDNRIVMDTKLFLEGSNISLKANENKQNSLNDVSFNKQVQIRSEMDFRDYISNKTFKSTSDNVTFKYQNSDMMVYFGDSPIGSMKVIGISTDRGITAVTFTVQSPYWNRPKTYSFIPPDFLYDEEGREYQMR